MTDVKEASSVGQQEPHPEIDISSKMKGCLICIPLTNEGCILQVRTDGCGDPYLGYSSVLSGT